MGWIERWMQVLRGSGAHVCVGGRHGVGSAMGAGAWGWHTCVGVGWFEWWVQVHAGGTHVFGHVSVHSGAGGAQPSREVAARQFLSNSLGL